MTVEIKQLTDQLAEVLTKKEKAYGSAFDKAEAFCKLIYPNGIAPNQYRDLLVLVRVFDKIMRIATNGSKNDPMDETPQMDGAGYFILAERNRRNTK